MTTVDDIVSSAGAAATPHPEAAAAAVKVLKRGGKAVDAAVAAVIACCVVLPDNVGLGGYGGCMTLYDAETKRVTALDFDSYAPAAFKPELYDSIKDASKVGYLSISVPAVVAGMALAIEKFGALSWADVSEHAVYLAEEGFNVTPGLAAAFQNQAQLTDKVSFDALFPDGVVPKAGDRFVQKDLARLIKRLREEGPQAFYAGDIPRKIVRQIKEHGGILSEEDFASCKARTIDPIHIDHNGYSVYAPPPPSGALTGFQVLRTLECLHMDAVEPWSAEYFHLLVECIKCGWEDRYCYFGDPDLTEVPVDLLLSSDYARKTADKIRNGKVTGTHTPAAGPTHTIHVAASDSRGNLASITATHGESFGSRVVIDGLGLVMGHGMSRFNYAVNSPNYPAPGKRMQHNMCPIVVLKDNKPYAALGLPGGVKIVTVTPQIIANILDFGTTISEALAAPRVHIENDGNLMVSSNLPESAVSELEKMGYEVQRVNQIAGPASGLIIDHVSGTTSAASEAGPDCVGVEASAER